eukprot:TRINITY_DN30166_c1_g3_i1.p1 TRINITY_DN30166_c1_g3~~TRINITY_DN30166_c1_g3_i1.p1  ORF type:complete len:760 (+),score=148.72 TRINITY_DN30166_c1_g3_i1:94-2373(+)
MSAGEVTHHAEPEALQETLYVAKAESDLLSQHNISREYTFGVGSSVWSPVRLSRAACELYFSRDEDVQQAAQLLADAIEGVCRIPPLSTPCARRLNLIHFEVLPLLRLFVFILTLVTFFETPNWCFEHPSARPGVPFCPNELYPSFSISYLSRRSNALIEVLLVTPLLLDHVLRRVSQGSNFWTSQHQIIRVIALALYVCDMTNFYLMPPAWVLRFRLAPYLRAVLTMTYSHSLRVRLETVVRALPGVAQVGSLTACLLSLYAWLGILIFRVSQEEGSEYFLGFGDALWSLLVLMTSANFPDVMMPAYHEHRYYFVFFAVFIVSTMYFLLPLFTGQAFHAYKMQQHDIETYVENLRLQNREKAYAALARKDGRVTTAQMREVFLELNHYHDIGYITEAVADKYVNKLDVDRSKLISDSEFKVVFDVLASESQRRFRPPILECLCPWLRQSAHWQGVKAFVKHAYFDAFVDTLLIVSLGLTFLETLDLLSGISSETSEPPWLSRLQLAITLVFILEAIVKLATQGFQVYWSSLKNKFDLVVTSATVAAVLAVYMPNGFNDKKFIRYVCMLRVARVATLLLRWRSYELLANTLVRMAPQAISMVKVLLYVMYIFSLVGVQLFGGVINTDPESPYSEAVADSDFNNSSGYFANNFNDMPSGMILLMELLVVNNWWVLCDGFTAAVGPAGRLYFVSFYVFGVLVCLNIVVAFTVSAFSEECMKVQAVSAGEGGGSGAAAEVTADGGAEDGAGTAPLLLNTTVI